MKPVIKKRGIILNSKDYKDNFKLLTILTIDGPMHVILKGANKMSSGTKKYTITPLEVDFLISQGKTISTFTEGYIINNYTNLKNSYDKNMVSLVMIEKILAFCEHVFNYELFYHFVKKMFELLDTYDFNSIILNIFEIKLLYLLGIAPNLNNCNRCQKKKTDLMLSITLGGCCCKECSNFIHCELTEEETKIFKYLYLIKLEKIDNQFLSLIANTQIKFDDFIDQYYEKYIDFYSSVKKVLKKIS